MKMKKSASGPIPKEGSKARMNIKAMNLPSVSYPAATAPALPFQAEVALPFNANNSGASGGFHVPSRKRLVIEHVSGSIALPNNQKSFQVRVDILQAGGGTQAGHYLTATFQGSRPGIGAYFSISQPIRLYAVGAVAFSLFRIGPGDQVPGYGQVNMSVSGYLVDIT